MTTQARMKEFAARRHAIADRATPTMRAMPTEDILPRMRRKAPTLKLHHPTVGDVLEAPPSALLRVVALGPVGVNSLYDLLDQIATETGGPRPQAAPRPATDAPLTLPPELDREIALSIAIRTALIQEGQMDSRDATILAAAILTRTAVR